METLCLKMDKEDQIKLHKIKEAHQLQQTLETTLVKISKFNSRWNSVK
jgi:hypothetical protein